MQELVVPVCDTLLTAGRQEAIPFYCRFGLNGSSYIQYIPIGRTTEVHLSGAWNDPGFTGNFSPVHTTGDGFDATWHILPFNREIPDTWTDGGTAAYCDTCFGVSLVETVDHYQQTMRSAKYAILFIALTFVVFFFVETLTGKRIHPIQYLLVGMALILFYCLLLSLSEHLGFTPAYLIAAVATIGLIAFYGHSIFKRRAQTGILTAVLCLLYIFLYVVLRLEEIALLVGSAGLFAILAGVMYFSRKINWYKEEDASCDDPLPGGGR
jgi:inner membrane protein